MNILVSIVFVACAVGIAARASGSARSTTDGISLLPNRPSTL